MRSKIYLSEEVENTERKFGSQQSYFPVLIVDKGGNQRHALLTHDVIKSAIERADKNEEDFPTGDFWEQLTGELKESDEFEEDNLDH